MSRRIAIVTGAGRGIGAAAARSLANAGVVPVLFDLPAPSEAESALSQIAETGIEPWYRQVDVTAKGDVEAAVESVVERFGGVHILVNNAGILSTTKVDSLSEEEWRRVMDVNVTGALFCAQAVLPAMREAGWGRIVNIASMAGRMGGITVGAAYAASKSALIGLTWNLSHALAPDGITVNAVAPGPVDGAMYDAFADEERRTLERSIPVGRLGSPGEIGAIVGFLCSEAAGYITGAVIDANGGAFTG